MISCTDYTGKFVERIGKLAEKIKTIPACVIGGSSVISVLTDSDFYHHSDIDLYVNFPLDVSNGITRINNDFCDWIVNELGGVLVLNKSYQNKSCKYYCAEYVLNVISTECTTDEEIVEYIKNTSDLSICQCAFDGERVHYHESVFTGKAEITNNHLRFSTFIPPEDEKERMMALRKFCDVFDIKRRTRQIKYMQRGFTIVGNTYSELDIQVAENFMLNQNNKEDFIYNVLTYICNRISENNLKSLDDVIQNRTLFPYSDEVPIISIHMELIPENFPWVTEWKRVQSKLQKGG